METQEPIVLSYARSATQAPFGGAVNYAASATDSSSGSLTNTFNFGDGKTETNTTGTATHIYTAAGRYESSVSVASSNSGALTHRAVIAVVVPAPESAALSTISLGGPGLEALWPAAGSWNAVSASFDFGDQSAPVTEGL